MKKRGFAWVLVLFLLFSVSSCSDDGSTVKNPPEAENGETTESNVKENGTEAEFIYLTLGDMLIEEWVEENTVCRVSWDKPRLPDAEAEKYPNLKTRFDEINAETSKGAKARIYEFTSAAKELRSENDGYITCEGSNDIYMQRADSSIVSYVEEKYVFTGGVHPDYAYKATNIDPQSGKNVDICDVVKDTSRLPEILEKKITERYSDVAFGNLREIFGNYKEEDYIWTVDYQGVTFWFSPYDIASYTVGPLSAKIYFNDEPELFNEIYTVSPADTYAIELPMNREIEFDMDETDGKTDLIYVEETPEQTGSYYMFKAVVNGKEYIDEKNYAYGFDAYLVHKDNKNYIYTVSYSDGSYNMFHVLDINGGEIKQISELYGTQFYSEFIEEEPGNGVVYKPFFNNPENFSMESDLLLIGNRNAVAGYKTGDDGCPVMTDEYFDISSEASQITKIPLEARVLPDETWETLPVGTELWALRTDAETYIDMKTEDGKEVRLNIDISGHPKKINGIPEEECFDNIMYAG